MAECRPPTPQDLVGILERDESIRDSGGWCHIMERGRIRLAKTQKLYPLVVHTACDDCLATLQSPTHNLNETYRGKLLGLGDGIGHRLAQLAATLAAEDQVWREKTAP